MIAGETSMWDRAETREGMGTYAAGEVKDKDGSGQTNRNNGAQDHNT